MSELDDLEKFVEKVAWRGNEAKKIRRGRKGSALFPPAGFVHREAAAHEPAPPPSKPVSTLEVSVPPPIIDVAVTSYTELMAGIQAQVGALGLKLSDFDDLAGFPAGLSGKVFGLLQVKRLGPEKMFDALRAAGLRLRLEVDPDQEAKMRTRISENYNPRQANQARNGHASSPLSTAVLSRVFKPLGRMGGKKRWERVSKKDRSAHMTMMINSRWKRERKKRKAANRRKQREATVKVSEQVVTA